MGILCAVVFFFFFFFFLDFLDSFSFLLSSLVLK